MATYDDFAKLDIRVGRITDVEDHDKAKKPMYKVTLYLGPELGTRTVVAGIKARYTREELINKKVACIVNLDPKTIVGVESHGMLLAAGDGALALSLLTVDRDVAEGSRIS